MSLSLAQLRWVVGGIIGAIWSAYVGGWLFLPAKDQDLQALRAVVEVVRVEQQRTSDAVNKLTTAVESLSGIVGRIGSAPQQLQQQLSPRGQARRVTPR